MSAAHFFAPSVDGDVVTLTGAEAHHAARALRMRAGEAVSVSDGAGTIIEGVIDGEPDARAVRIVVRARRRVEPRVPRLIVYPAVPKAGKLDLVVQKLTEIGVDEIRPWFAIRSVVRWDEPKRRAQGERLRAVALAAAKQSHRAFLPLVADPAPLDPPPSAVVLHEGAEVRLSAVLPEAPPAEIALIVGPEGGLDASEIDAFRAAGTKVASVGSQILRAETAAIVVPVLVLGRYHLLG